MTNITVEKIDKIVNKIEENISKKLSQSEAQKLLVNINKDLKGVKENVEKKQQKVVDEKIKELKGKIDESLSDEDGWGTVKILLKEDVKGGLEQLKSEVIKWGIIEQKPGENVFSREIGSSETSVIVVNEPKGSMITEELVKWRNLFPNRSPEGALEDLKKLASIVEEERIKHKEELDKIQKDLGNSKGSSEEIIKISENVMQMADKYVSDIGQRAFPVIGPLIGTGFGLAHGLIETGAFMGTEAMNKLDGARKDGCDTVENFRGGAERLAGQAIEAATGPCKLTEALFGGKAQVKALKERLEEKENQIKEAKEEKERLIKEAKEEIKSLEEKKDKQIEEAKKEKDEQIKKLEEQLQKKEDRIDKLENQIEQLQKSKNELLVAQIEVGRPVTPTNQ